MNLLRKCMHQQNTYSINLKIQMLLFTLACMYISFIDKLIIIDVAIPSITRKLELLLQRLSEKDS